MSVPAREQWQPPNDRIKALVGEMIDRGAYSVAGAYIPKQFEEAFASYIGAPYCFALDHGTCALWSAYYGVGVRPGDEVLHPCYTWICSIAPAVHMGARPGLLRDRPRAPGDRPAPTWRGASPRAPRPSRIVHLYGNVCDMDAIMAIARKHNIAVIEDCSATVTAPSGTARSWAPSATSAASRCRAAPSAASRCRRRGGHLRHGNRELFERMLLFGQLNRAGLMDRAHATPSTAPSPHQPRAQVPCPSLRHGHRADPDGEPGRA